MSDIPRAQDQLFAAGSSARAKYSALVVGRPGWGALAALRAGAAACRSTCPGALGLALASSALYPSLLGACGRNVVFGQNVTIRHPHKVRIGDNVVIDDNCLVDAKGDGNAGITIGSGVFVGRNSILSCKNGDIDIADGANIGFNCEVFSASRVTIGRDTLLAAYCYVIGGDHDFSDPSAPVLAQGRRSSGVTIGAGAWLGAGAKILDGVTDRRRRDRRRRRRGPRGGARRRDRGRHPRARRRAARRGARVTRQGSRAGRPRLNVLQVCDHLGWEGSRMHGVKRLFSWMIPRFDPERFNVSLVSLRKKDLSEETLESMGDRHLLPAQVEVRSGDADGAAEGDGSAADRHPAPARLRRDHVRPDCGADARGCRRSCTSTRT